MKYTLGILLFVVLYSCSTGASISKDELRDLREEVKFLETKVDSLESELARKLDTDKLLEHDSVLFFYRRTPCLGSCPVFKFSVYQDGWATYEGKNYVDMIGVYTAKLSPAQLQQIHNIFQGAFFYTFRNEYDDSRLDIPAMIVEYHGPQGIKKVVARTEIPYTFRTMTVELEKLADEIMWNPAE